ncbi:hypothetical protein MHM93_14845 [Pseudoalteromonas sp. MM17-2]|uniref:hypothetical protein n=1 Tax=Pseudoalteromonas sp. MM17-2 TaxID=2917753 RepID=UPI001EF5EB97|nr:hypothetical protein [Pseudoalteromonas sp. MM17-2]MCG7545457.1 hypothetical protein [Pseudoalteromonas sp. MM17-2]
MDFERAKQELIDSAVGHNEYAAIIDWKQLAEAAEQEQMFAADRVRVLGGLMSLATRQAGLD